MNNTLYALNALALIALVAFHFQDGKQPDAALVHVQADHFMARPAAQLADMKPHRGMSVLTSQQEQRETVPADHTERYTF
ncbi:hypothetical protein [Pseudomonas putida]